MIVRHLRAIVAGLVLGWLPSPAGASTGAEPIARLRLESYRKGVAARIEIGGRQRLFQLDTAGGLTVISPALAKELTCGPWGSVTGFHMTGTKISAPRCDALHMQWGDLPLTSPVVAVMEVGTPDTPIDGLLALDAFAGRTVTIDFARRELVIESSTSLRERISPARSAALPCRCSSRRRPPGARSGWSSTAATGVPSWCRGRS